jgi:hypothetical protein
MGQTNGVSSHITLRNRNIYPDVHVSNSAENFPFYASDFSLKGNPHERTA